MNDWNIVYLVLWLSGQLFARPLRWSWRASKASVRFGRTQWHRRTEGHALSCSHLNKIAVPAPIVIVSFNSTHFYLFPSKLWKAEAACAGAICVVMCATCGHGDFPQNAGLFWSSLSAQNLAPKARFITMKQIPTLHPSQWFCGRNLRDCVSACLEWGTAATQIPFAKLLRRLSIAWWILDSWWFCSGTTKSSDFFQLDCSNPQLMFVPCADFTWPMLCASFPKNRKHPSLQDRQSGCGMLKDHPNHPHDPNCRVERIWLTTDSLLLKDSNNLLWISWLRAKRPPEKWSMRQADRQAERQSVNPTRTYACSLSLSPPRTHTHTRSHGLTWLTQSQNCRSQIDSMDYETGSRALWWGGIKGKGFWYARIKHMTTFWKLIYHLFGIRPIFKWMCG